MLLCDWTLLRTAPMLVTGLPGAALVPPGLADSAADVVRGALTQRGSPTCRQSRAMPCFDCAGEQLLFLTVLATRPAAHAPARSTSRCGTTRSGPGLNPGEWRRRSRPLIIDGDEIHVDGARRRPRRGWRDSHRSRADEVEALSRCSLIR